MKPNSTSSQSEHRADIDVLWITAGLGCDGDTIAITAATQPSIEEIVMGAIPGIPKVRFHNPFLAYENGDEFLERCGGPVVQCNVGKRGWINGMGGCPNVGGICIGWWANNFLASVNFFAAGASLWQYSGPC